MPPKQTGTGLHVGSGLVIGTTGTPNAPASLAGRAQQRHSPSASSGGSGSAAACIAASSTATAAGVCHAAGKAAWAGDSAADMASERASCL